MKRGRPTKSVIRQNIVEILNLMKRGYGYEVHKVYKQIFPNCTREVIYYHLKKGVETGEFAIEEVRQEKGEYSWGGVVQKTYYKLGPNAEPKGDQRVQEFFAKKK